MAESQSLLAHLTPWFYRPIEDRATDALAYILNRSTACRGALGNLLRDSGSGPELTTRVSTQVSEDSQSRPDMVGFDEQGKKRLMTEVKFWAVLQPRQAWRYYQKLEQAGPGVLLFICPESHIKYLWPEVCEQLEQDPEAPISLKEVETSDGTRRANAVDTEKRVVIVSWEMLLDRLEATVLDFGVKSDIHQLRGLVQKQNEVAFPPLHAHATAHDFEVRNDHFRRMISDAVGRGRKDGWLSTKGLTWGRTKSYHRRYFGVVEASPVWLGLGVEYREELFERTPIWVSVPIRYWPETEQFEGLIQDTDYWKLPIHLKTDAVGGDVLDDIVAQLKEIAERFVAIKQHHAGDMDQ